MPVQLKVPAVGESITEVQIGRWLKDEGDRVEKDETLVEIETDKITVELPAPAAGTLARITRKQGDEAAVGDIIGELNEGEGEASGGAAAGKAASVAVADASPASHRGASAPGGGRPEATRADRGATAGPVQQRDSEQYVEDAPATAPRSRRRR